ncbi:hypothetical protein GCM10027448_25280 [Nocardioides dilutus]
MTALALGVPLLTAPVAAAPSATTTVDDRALVRKGVWRNKSFAGAHAGTLSKSKDKGATLTSVDATTGGGKVLLQFGPGRGKLVIKVGGVRQKVVLTAADSKQIKKVRFSGDGVVTLKVKKPGRGVYVDALELKLSPPPPPPDPPGPAAGDVIITEWLSNPSTVPDSQGEWFELHNVAGGPRTLTGCTVTNQAAGSAVLPTAVVAAGGRYLLARSPGAGSNGGLAEDATFGFALTSSDSLTLTCGANVIDTVSWASETIGKSLSLDPDHYTAADNDAPANYCLGSTPYGTGGDFGTPGALNTQCP